MSISDQLTALSAQVAALSPGGAGNNAPVLAAIANVAALIGGVGSVTLPGNPATSTLASLVLAPTSVTGGTASTATVSLSAVSSSDTVVALTSNNAAATIPANVTIPAGSLSANFQVSTGAGPLNVLLTASFAGVSQNAQLIIS
jgi:hypothetical protein